MKKKSPVLGAALGLLLIGLPYSGGWKKGGAACLVLAAIALAANMTLGTSALSIVVDTLGAFLGYMWTHEYNAELDEEPQAVPDASAVL